MITPASSIDEAIALMQPAVENTQKTLGFSSDSETDSLESANSVEFNAAFGNLRSIL